MLERNSELLHLRLDEVDQASVEQLLMIWVDLTQVVLIQETQQTHRKLIDIVVLIDHQPYGLLLSQCKLQAQSQLLIGTPLCLALLVLIVETECLDILLVPV